MTLQEDPVWKRGEWMMLEGSLLMLGVFFTMLPFIYSVIGVSDSVLSAVYNWGTAFGVIGMFVCFCGIAIMAKRKRDFDRW